MSGGNCFGVGFCLGVGIEALVWAACVGNDLSSSACVAWITFFAGVGVAGVLAGLLNAGDTSK